MSVARLIAVVLIGLILAFMAIKAYAETTTILVASGYYQGKFLSVLIKEMDCKDKKVIDKVSKMFIDMKVKLTKPLNMGVSTYIDTKGKNHEGCWFELQNKIWVIDSDNLLFLPPIADDYFKEAEGI